MLCTGELCVALPSTAFSRRRKQSEQNALCLEPSRSPEIKSKLLVRPARLSRVRPAPTFPKEVAQQAFFPALEHTPCFPPQDLSACWPFCAQISFWSGTSRASWAPAQRTQPKAALCNPQRPHRPVSCSTQAMLVRFIASFSHPNAAHSSTLTLQRRACAPKTLEKGKS